MTATAGRSLGRPRIGVSAAFSHPDEPRAVFSGKTLLYAEQSMLRWLQSGGALAYLIPTASGEGRAATSRASTSSADIGDYVADLDGLLLQGGADISPSTYGEHPRRPEWAGDAVRDRYEIDLVHAFLAAGKPVLGVCRGLQLLNVAFGGTLHQDVGEQVAGALVHRDTDAYDRNLHAVAVEPGSHLAALVDPAGSARRGPHTVNSVHHQSVCDLGDRLVVEARATDDGVVEAIRWDDAGGWALGVQWHPEFMFDATESLAGLLPPGAPPLLDNTPILDELCERAVRCRS